MDTFRVEGDSFFVGEVEYPHTMVVSKDLDCGKLGLVRERQAFIECAAGDYAVSVIWGTNAYSVNHAVHGDDFTETPTAVEVGVVSRHGVLQNWWGDNVDPVKGYQTPDQVNRLIEEVNNA